MRASFTDARGNSPRDGTAHARQGYPSAPAEGLSAEEQAEIRRAGLQSSAADSRQKRATAAQGGGYQQSKPLELTVHSIKMLAHEQKDRHVLPGAQLADLPAEVCPRARLTASTVTFDWSHTLKLDARGQEAGAALRDALFPRRTDGLPASTRRLQVTAASAVPADVRKAFTMFDFVHSCAPTRRWAADAMIVCGWMCRMAGAVWSPTFSLIYQTALSCRTTLYSVRNLTANTFCTWLIMLKDSCLDSRSMIMLKAVLLVTIHLQSPNPSA